MLAELFAVMAPVLAGAGLGYLWVRLGHPYPVDFITRLVFNIGTPSLVLASLAGADIDATTFGQTMLAAALVIITMGPLLLWWQNCCAAVGECCLPP